MIRRPHLGIDIPPLESLNLGILKTPLHSPPLGFSCLLFFKHCFDSRGNSPATPGKVNQRLLEREAKHIAYIHMLCLADSAYHAAQGLQSFTQWLYLSQHWIHVRCISWLTA